VHHRKVPRQCKVCWIRRRQDTDDDAPPITSTSTPSTSTNSKRTRQSTYQPTVGVLLAIPMDVITGHNDPVELHDVENLKFSIACWSHGKQQRITKIMTSVQAYKFNAVLVQKYTDALQYTMVNNEKQSYFSYREVRLNGHTHYKCQMPIWKSIQDVAMQNPKHLLFHECPSLIACGASTVLVNKNGQVTMPPTRGVRDNTSTTNLLTWAPVECAEHLKSWMQPLNMDCALIGIESNVDGVSGETIYLANGFFFTNPSNNQFKMKCCRHCHAPLYKGEDPYCCNKGKTVLPAGHFEFWKQQFPPFNTNATNATQQFFEACNTNTLRQHPRLCNNTLAFAMLKHDSIHGTGRVLTPEFHPWMISIQGRTYHTMLNSAQPHPKLNNNISWCKLFG
jgi:hypothetical protein